MSVLTSPSPVSTSVKRTVTNPAPSPLVRVGVRLLVILAAVVLWWVIAEVVFAANPVVSKMGPGSTVVGLAQLLADPGF